MPCSANEKLKASPLCLSIVKNAEGFKDKAYKCPAGIWTIGYGHTTNVKKGDTCTQDRANAWLVTDIAYAENTVKKAVNVPLSQGQFDALTSFVYNVGPGTKGGKSGFVKLSSGAPSTLLRLVNEGDFAGAAGEFDKWVFAGGNKSLGLWKRRTVEKTLFLEA